MSPHQRVLTAAALTAKSRRTRSARAAAAGSGWWSLPPARSAAAQARGTHQPGHPLAGMAMTTAAQLSMDAWGAVAALGHMVDLADVLGELLVGALTRDGVFARWA